MLAILLILPLIFGIVFAVGMPQEHAKYVRYIALLVSLISLGLLYFVTSGAYSYQWLAAQTWSLAISFNVSAINLLLLLMVLVVAPLVLLYSFGYIDTPSKQKRFYTEMLAFEAAMIVFAISSSFITMLIAWGFLSLTSYLLIGFWDDRKKANRAARKAITTVFIGDVAFLGAVAVVGSAFGSFDFSTVLSAMSLHPEASFVAAALLGVAILSKSAQFPFSEWLPDAMEGPAPVSAFLHSATMVKAGVFVAVLLLPLLVATHVAPIIQIISFITIIIATMNAMKETQIKRVIAYSTIQELAIMLFAVSSGAVLAAVYFFFAQTFYKAALFLSSGAAMNGSGKEDIREIYGIGQNKLLYISTLFGVLALAGFLPFDGFFSNAIIGSSFAGNLLVYIPLMLFGMLTSAFIFRWMFMISRKPRTSWVSIKFDAIPKSMTFSMIVLGTAAILASIAFAYFPQIAALSAPQYMIPIAQFSISIQDAAIVTGLAVAGALISYLLYRRKFEVKSKALKYLFLNGVLLSCVYDKVGAAVLAIGRAAGLVDSYLDSMFEWMGSAISESSPLMRRLSSGSINLYALAVGIMVVLMFVFVYFVK